MAQTLYEKLWNSHLVREESDGTGLLYIDRHLVHEVTSPQAFEGLEVAHRQPWRIDSVVATADHNVPTARIASRASPIRSRSLQVDTLDQNVDKFHVKTYFGMNDRRQGIVHVIGPEQGATLPGMTVVCGDSHTSTHGAFAALAFGIGTSEVEHVLATQCLAAEEDRRRCCVRCEGALPAGVTAKDLVLAIIGKIGTAGGTGYAIEFGGSHGAFALDGRAHDRVQHGDRGGRARRHGGRGRQDDRLPARPSLCAAGRDVRQGGGVLEARSSPIRARSSTRWSRSMPTSLKPQVTWGTSPEMVVSDRGPRARSRPREGSGQARGDGTRAHLHGPRAQHADHARSTWTRSSSARAPTRASRTCARPPTVVRGRRVAKNVKLALVVPGSGLVKAQAEKEGLDRVFKDSGFEWRDAGCSMCLGMNDDKLSPGERCASTSNRNFEGRQGAGGRTHLVSPEMAAAAAIAGHFVDIRRTSWR